MSSDSSANTPPGSAPELVLAKWSDRFFAWLIDFIIVNAVLWAIFAAASVPFLLEGTPDRWFNNANGAGRWAVTSLVFLGYWTYFESSTGQSLGKMVLKIKTTDLYGGKADVRNVAIQSFGKAFILPLDLILGWIFTNDKRQRIFARAASTIVVKAVGDSPGAQNVQYRKE